MSKKTKGTQYLTDEFPPHQHSLDIPNGLRRSMREAAALMQIHDRMSGRGSIVQLETDPNKWGDPMTAAAAEVQRAFNQATDEVVEKQMALGRMHTDTMALLDDIREMLASKDREIARLGDTLAERDRLIDVMQADLRDRQDHYEAYLREKQRADRWYLTVKELLGGNNKG